MVGALIQNDPRLGMVMDVVLAAEYGVSRERVRQIRSNGRRLYVHRLVWMLRHPNDPAPVVVRHKCDNPPCCNPDHLLSGTHVDNTRDAFERGRRKRGVPTRKSRLTEDQMREAATSPDPAKAVGEKFGISRTYVWALRARFRKVAP